MLVAVGVPGVLVAVDVLDDVGVPAWPVEVLEGVRVLVVVLVGARVRVALVVRVALGGRGVLVDVAVFGVVVGLGVMHGSL